MAQQVAAFRDEAPGSAPLKNAVHEKLARERAAGASMAEAWRAIGRDPAKGNQCRTFGRHEIQARVEYLRGRFNEMAGLSLAALQHRLLRIADASVIDFFEADEDGRLRLRDLTKLRSAVTAPISELQIDADGAVKLKTVDKMRALEALLKTIGFGPEDPERGTTLEDLVMRSQDLRQGMQLTVVTGVPRAPNEPRAEAPPRTVSRAPTGSQATENSVRAALSATAAQVYRV
jgi:hypothetical protein